MKRTKFQIAQELIAHLGDEDSTLNDSTVTELYAEYHGVPADETDLEEVENWAIWLRSWGIK